ncbi:MAG: hypothetical protein NTX50_07515, partial [Candidatus Sumerlaeota bacterium]|nr:hypothetical protein [Candidatus Sumerlaeota bacterium]
SVADSMQLTGDGVYALYVPKGFSGTVTIQAPDYIVSPFHRAYQALSDNRDGQDFALRGQLSSQTQLNGDYQIVYKKNGRGPNWYPSDICQFRDGGLEISSSTSSDTLKITKSAAARKARRATAPLRFIHSTGGFASLYSEADIAELRANGLLKRITTVNAAIGDCFTTGALGIIQMTSRPDAGADVITNIQATAGAAPLASLSLTGVKIETLRAGSQSFSAIKLISKKNTATSGSKTIAWVSESGFLGGAGVGNDLEILRARALTATGALLAPAIADGAIKAINTRGICVTANRTVGVYPAHISIGWLRDRDTSVTVSAVGGDIEPGLYLFDGRIALFSAKAIRLPKGANFPGAFAGGMIGNRDAPTTDIAPTTNALTVEGQVVVAAGLNVTTATTPASKINTARDIANVTGTDGVYGLFLAGATLTTDSAILAPDGMGRLLTVNTTASRGKGWLRIYGNESRPAKVLPAAMRDRIPILYNDKP